MRENHPTYNSSYNRNVSIKNGTLSGFIASIVSSFALVIFTAFIVIPEFNFISIQGSIFGLTNVALASWAVYFIIGTLIWGPLYAIFDPYLPNPWIIKGILFGITVWIIVMIVLMPLAGEDVFLKRFGLKASAIVLTTDLVFGIALSYFYEKFRTNRRM